MFFTFLKPICSHPAASIAAKALLIAFYKYTVNWYHVNTFLAYLKPIYSPSSGLSAPLSNRCLKLLNGCSWQCLAAKICDCCSQPLYSDFAALLEAVLQRCNSAAHFVRDKALVGRNTSLFWRDAGSIRGLSKFFVSVYLSFFFQKPKHLFKKNVLSKLLTVTV